MSNLFRLTNDQRAKPSLFFPKLHGKPRIDDRRVLGGITFINRKGVQWRDAPAEYGPHKTLYNRWKRCGHEGIFAQMIAGLAAARGEEKTVMIDLSKRRPCVRMRLRKYRKAHRTASSLGVKKGGADA